MITLLPPSDAQGKIRKDRLAESGRGDAFFSFPKNSGSQSHCWLLSAAASACLLDLHPLPGHGEVTAMPYSVGVDIHLYARTIHYKSSAELSICIVIVSRSTDGRAIKAQD